MHPIGRQTLWAAAAVAVLVGAAGCANMTEEQQRGTARGAAIGAAAGAVLGAVTDGSKGAVRGAAIGAGVGAVGGHIWSTRMEEQKRRMEESTRGTGVEVTQTADNQLKLNIPSDVSFAVGRADIQPNFRPILDTFAQGMVRNPEARVLIVDDSASVRQTLTQVLESDPRIEVIGAASDPFVAAKRIQEEIKAKKAQGLSIDLEDLKPVLFEVANIFGQQADALGGRIASEFASINDPAIIKARMLEESRRIRAQIAERLIAFIAGYRGHVSGDSDSAATEGSAILRTWTRRLCRAAWS